ncbi:muellerian-inhibiting factor isoform X2 [Trachinotus anak]|uniref:muellerian-inhibiting factor isoform X2 n=1 Tax=Trachinotus anak TaxID=443729 RepID=UPI0039F19FC6
MLVVNVLSCGVLMLCWARHVSHGQQLMPDHNPAMTVSDSSSGSVLLELAKETSRNQRNGLEVLHPTGVLVAEEDDGETLMLTFDLPPSPLLKLNPVLLLAFESPFKGGDVDVTFTSQSLQLNTQSACISGGTEYILLTGNASEGTLHQKWRISVETNSPDMKKSLKDILIGGKPGSNISIIPLLLFSGGTGTDTRHTHVSSSFPASSQTFSFLCELKRFLGDVLPNDHPESPPLQLDSFPSMPPLSLGLSSSETLLAGLINSSSPTVFCFPRWGSISQGHPGQLAMSSALVEEVRQRLEQIGMQIMELIREKEVGHRATERLERLKDFSTLPTKELAAGESQYRAFLLLKALQTVARVYELQRGLRATRADPSNPVRGNVCGLRSLTVSLERRLVGPNTANINNCQGSCAFPLTNANNHAVLLHFYIESGNTDERPPCCVPVAYDPLEVVDLNEDGTYLSIKPDLVAKECGCR